MRTAHSVTGGANAEVRQLTIGDIARQHDIPIWRVRRIFERHILPEFGRVGRYRTVPEDRVPDVVEALRDAGYLPLDSPTR